MQIPAKPPVGHLIAYEYLWSSQTNRDDGLKTYPVAVVASRDDRGPFAMAYVLAMSHRAPKDGDRALEVPLKLKRHLGLDDEPAWIYTGELNVFAWPGPDLRPAERLSTRPLARGTCVIGPLPSDWFSEVIRHLGESYRAARVKAVTRGE